MNVFIFQEFGPDWNLSFKLFHRINSALDGFVVFFRLRYHIMAIKDRFRIKVMSRGCVGAGAARRSSRILRPSSRSSLGFLRHSIYITG